MKFRIRSLIAAVTFISLPFFITKLNAAKKPKSNAADTPVTSATVPARRCADVPDLEFVSRLRDEEFNHGQVMDIMSDLTDKIGARVTGSPNMKKANEWSRDLLGKWGLKNSHVEPWGTFGRGWAYQRCEVRMVAPDFMEFLALPQVWTPGTNGPVRGQVMQMIANSPADLDKYRGKLAGKIVLLGEARGPSPIDKPLFSRADEADLSKTALYDIPQPPDRAREEENKKRNDFKDLLAKFLTDERPAVVLEITRQPGMDGTIYVQQGGSFAKGKTFTVPKVTLSVEHFGRVARLLAKSVPVELEVNVEARFYDDDDKAYNTLADIPGTDPKLKDQLVMLGGHMDSWQAGEGATDNGAGTAVVMEAVRLLEKLNVQPRRTIRVALWSAEEQGLLGSGGYVKQHFGSRPENKDPKYKDLPEFMRPASKSPIELKPEQKLVSVYFNYDNGSGKIRGIFLQENAAVAPIFSKWMEPFHDLGMTTLTMRNTGATDHLSFDGVGIPGFQFLQDGLDYGLTHHSNLDVYEHIQPDDVKQAAVIIASFVYDAAMCDEMIPRKPLRPEEPEAK